MPFGEYDDFDACVRANSDKDDPDAYCAAIKRKIEGKQSLSQEQKQAYMRQLAEFEEGNKVVWTSNGEPVHGRVADVHDQFTPPGLDDPITAPEGDDVYSVYEWDDSLSPPAYRESPSEPNIAKTDNQLDESQKDLPPATEGNFVGDRDASAGVRLAVGISLDNQPIRREELSNGDVAYRNIKLLDKGVWTDQNSRTPTLYDAETFDNLEPSYSKQMQGPPTNIAHDVHKLGDKKGQVHDASIAGYVDPQSLREDGDSLFGDFIFDSEKPAGAFADDNLKSALQNDGTAGFSPSVELDPIELESTPDHPRATEHVTKARLTGVGLVRDPASESVDLQEEVKNRVVALSNHANKSPTNQTMVMSKQKSLMEHDEVREIMTRAGIEVADMTDDEVADMATSLHDDLMAEITDSDMAKHGQYGDDMDMMDDDEDEDDDDMDMKNHESDDMDMMDDDMDMAEMKSQMGNVMSRLEDLEDAMSDSLSASKAQAQLASADTVTQLKKDKRDLERRLSELEDQGDTTKTLAEDNTDIDYSDDDSGYSYDPARGSLSR